MIGDKVKELRKEYQLTQKELAEVLQVSDRTISHWEAGYTEPPLRMVVLLKEYFKVSYEELLE